MHALVLAIAIACAAAHAGATPPLRDSVQTTLGVWGAPGFQAVVEPAQLPAQTFSLNFGGRYGWAANFLTASDAARLFAQEGHFLWTAMPALDVGLGFVGTNIADAGVPGDGASLVGLPVLHLRWTDGHPWPVRAGAMVQVVPTAADASLRVQDAAFALTGLAGYRVGGAWRLALNLGFVYDRSNEALGGPISVSQHFANGLTLGNRVTGGLAGSWQARTASGTWEPFAELTGEVATSHSTPAGIALLSAGGKWLPARLRGVQVAVGTDVRLAGAPAEGSIFPGRMPWTVYARASITTDYRAEPPTVVMHCPPTTSQPAAPPPAESPNTLHATLLDPNGRAVKNAVIAFNATRAEMLAYDPETGRLRIERFVCGRAQLVDLVVTVPGAVEQRFQVDCDTWLADPNRVSELCYSGQLAPSSLTCYVRDRRSGAFVPHSRVSLPQTDVSAQSTGKSGAVVFEKLKPGLYRLQVQAPGHVPQERVVDVGDASAVIMNIDLEPF